MRKSLLLLLAITIGSIGLKSNDYVTRANVADPILVQATNGANTFNLKASTVFSKYLSGMALGVTSCPADIFIDLDATTCDSTVSWNLPSLDGATAITDVKWINEITNDTTSLANITDTSVADVAPGAYSVMYEFNDASVCQFAVFVDDITGPMPLDTFILGDKNDTLFVDEFITETVTYGTDLDENFATISLTFPEFFDACGNYEVEWFITGATNVNGTNDLQDVVLNVGSHFLGYIVIDTISGLDYADDLELVIVDDQAPFIQACPQTGFYGPYYVNENCQFNFGETAVRGEDNVSPLSKMVSYYDVGTVTMVDTIFGDIVPATLANTTNDSVKAANLGTGEYVVRQWVLDTATMTFSEDTCIEFFTVIDTIAPTIDDLPANRTVYMGASCTAQDTIALPTATFDDNCGIDSTFYMVRNASTLATIYMDENPPLLGDVTFPSVGVYTFYQFAEDLSGFTVDYQYNITVVDTTNPTINTGIFGGSREMLFTLNAACDTTVNIDGILVDDNCDIQSVTIGTVDLWNGTDVDDIDLTLTQDTTEFIFVVTDVNNNSVQDTIFLYLQDAAKPVLNFGLPYADIDEVTEPGESYYRFYKTNFLNFIQASDNCDVDSIFIDVEFDTEGTIGVDTSFNFSPSQINQPFELLFSAPVDSNLKANDSLVHRVTIWAQDKLGTLSDPSSFTVTVHDVEAPTLFTVDTLYRFVNGQDCNSFEIVRDSAYIIGEELVNDNCASDSALLARMTNDFTLEGDTIYGLFPVGNTVITFSTFDGNGQTVTRELVVNVTDTINPNISFETDTLYTSDSLCTATGNIALPLTEDNCVVDSVYYSFDNVNFVNVTDSLSVQLTFPLGNSSIFWKAVDSVGNETILDQDITVIDDKKPIVNAVNNWTLYAPASGCTVDLDSATFSRFDNCSVASETTLLIKPSTNDTLLNLTAAGRIVQTLDVDSTYMIVSNAIDASGNVADTKITMISVLDTIAPTINDNDTIRFELPQALCEIKYAVGGANDPFNLQISDNCLVDSIDFEINNSGIRENINDSITFVAQDTIDIEVRARDIYNNWSTENFVVVITDELQNRFVDGPQDTIIESTANECTQIVFYDAPTYNDCIGRGLFGWYDIPSGSDFALGTTTVTFYLTDFVDTASYSFDVTIIDVQKPVFNQVPGDITLYSTANNCDVQFNYQISVQDNCDATGVDTEVTYPSGTFLAPGVYTNKIRIEDQSGNADSTTHTITVLDTISPVFTSFPSNIVTCDPNVSFDVQFNDNCGATATVTGYTEGQPFAEGTTTVTYDLEDASGNTASRSFTVTVSPQATVANAGTDADVCITDAVVLAANAAANGETGTWTSATGTVIFDDVNDPNTTAIFPAAGLFSVTWTIDNGVCDPSASSVIYNVFDVPTANAGQDQSLVNDYDANLNGFAQNGTITWTVNTSASILDPNNNRTFVNDLAVGDNVFTMTVDNNGCAAASDEVVITVVEDIDFASNVPTSFTPNNDGVNDTWAIPGLDGNQYQDYKVQVFNRWGGLVYEGDSNTAAWDGTNDGDELPVASYYYVIDLGNGDEPIQGIVTIIK